MSSLQFDPADEEALRLCLGTRERQRSSHLHRQAQFVRHVRHRTATFALIPRSSTKDNLPRADLPQSQHGPIRRVLL